MWGRAVDGEVRAFRGEAPEAWRALGRFSPPGSSYPRSNEVDSPAVDLDGDSVADTLGGLHDRGFIDREATGTHAVVARSGRDGHVIWKAVLDPWDRWSESKCRDWYDLEAPGDLDGDGTTDVIARRIIGEGRRSATRMPNAVPIQFLSGRTGARLWSAGPLPSGLEPQVYWGGFWPQACAVEPGAAPDVLLRHHTSPATSGPTSAAMRMPGRPSPSGEDLRT